MVWENQLVEESNPMVSMAQIRRALDESARRRRCIATVSGQGYGLSAIFAKQRTMTRARYSPGGKRIACGYRFEGNLELTILGAENGQIEKRFTLPPTADLNNGFRWTPDGKTVTYRGWNNGIWRQNLTGGAPERIAGLPEEKLYSYDWSRDGKLFAFTRGAEIRDLVLIQNSK